MNNNISWLQISHSLERADLHSCNKYSTCVTSNSTRTPDFHKRMHNTAMSAYRPLNEICSKDSTCKLSSGFFRKRSSYTMKIQVSWDVIPCPLVKSYRCFEGALYVELHGQAVQMNVFLSC